MSDVHPAGRVPVQLKAITKARVTGLLNMYHQLPGEDARQFQFPVERFNELSDVGVYQRPITVGDEWVQLDTGWIDAESVGMYILYNKTGKTYTTNPTQEQRDVDATAVIKIAPHKLILPPGLFSVICPDEDCRAVSVCSLNAPARLEYVVVPK